MRQYAQGAAHRRAAQHNARIEARAYSSRRGAQSCSYLDGKATHLSAMLFLAMLLHHRRAQRDARIEACGVSACVTLMVVMRW